MNIELENSYKARYRIVRNLVVATMRTKSLNGIDFTTTPNGVIAKVNDLSIEFSFPHGVPSATISVTDSSGFVLETYFCSSATIGATRFTYKGVCVNIMECKDILSNISIEVNGVSTVYLPDRGWFVWR